MGMFGLVNLSRSSQIQKMQCQSDHFGHKHWLAHLNNRKSKSFCCRRMMPDAAPATSTTCIVVAVAIFAWWPVDGKIWEQAEDIVWTVTMFIGGVDWFMQCVSWVGGENHGIKHSFCHFLDGMHGFCFWSCQMAAVFAWKCAGSISMTHNDFCLWCFCQKMGNTSAEAVHCTWTNCGVLDHNDPFLVLPWPLPVLQTCEQSCLTGLCWHQMSSQCG